MLITITQSDENWKDSIKLFFKFLSVRFLDFSHKKIKREINTHVSSTLYSICLYLMSTSFYIFFIQNEIILKKADFLFVSFLWFFHKLLNKLVCNLFHSRQILDWIFWQAIQFFDFLFVHYKIQSKSKLKTMHNVMKNIEQNMIHQYIKHHKHHQIVSFIFLKYYDIKLFYIVLFFQFFDEIFSFFYLISISTC